MRRSRPRSACYTSSGIRFRNVYVNAEHGYAVCDESGCGTILRAGKFAYDNALEDVTRGRQVRERNLAVLDVDDAGGAAEPRIRATVLAPGAAGREARRRIPLDRGRGGGRERNALLRRSPPAADLLVVARDSTEGRARRAARCGEPRRSIDRVT